MTLGPFQLVVIALIVLLLFGRGRIGQSLGELGDGVKAFRKGLETPDEPHALPVEAGEPHATADK